MISLQVLDIDLDSVCEKQYDVSLFASGYESRCIHAPKLISHDMIANPLVFGFEEESHSGKRDQNDDYFREEWNCVPIPLSSDDETPIYEHLNEYTQSLDCPLHILMDYSSMSRLWYTAVLNWARFATFEKDVIIDFVYTMGRYEIGRASCRERV